MVKQYLHPWLRGACALVLILVGSAAHAQDWGGLATISNTMGVNANRICLGEASRGDIGCPTYAPQILSNGTISTTGLTVNGVAITGSGGGGGDTISSNTTSIVAQTGGVISITTNGSTANYFDTGGRLITAGVSVTGFGISASSGYFPYRVGIGLTNPAAPLDVSTTSAYFRSNNQGNGPLISLLNSSGATAGTFGPGIIISNGVAGVHGFIITQMQSAGSPLVIARESTPFTNYLFMDQSGNVGISVTTLTAKLEVAGTISATGLVINGQNLAAGVATDRISTTNVASGAQLGAVVADKGTVSFTLAGTAGAAYIHSTAGFVGPGVSTTGAIFGTNIYSSGALGVGKTSAATAVDVSGSDIRLLRASGVSITSIHMRTDGSNSFINNMDGFLSNGSTGNGVLFITGQAGMRLGYGNVGSTGTAAFTINNIGNIGISTTSPNAKLDVYGTISATNGYYSDNVGIGSAPMAAGLSNLFVHGGSLGSTAGNIVSITTFRGLSANADQLNFTLQRNSAGSDWTTAGLRIQRAVDTSNMGYIQFGNWSTGGDMISFGRNTTENMRLDGDGDLGLGTTNPTAKLQVSGTLRVENAGGSAVIEISRTAGNFGYIQYGTSGSRRWHVGMDSAAEAGSMAGSNFYINRANDAGTFIDTPFSIQRSTGRIGISTTNPTAELTVNGTVAATAFSGNGSGLTNLPSSAVDRISTTGVASGALLGAVVADKGTVSFTLAGTAGAAYLHSTLGFVGPGVSTTGGVSGTTGYFASTARIVSWTTIGANTAPTSALEVVGQISATEIKTAGNINMTSGGTLQMNGVSLLTTTGNLIPQSANTNYACQANASGVLTCNNTGGDFRVNLASGRGTATVCYDSSGNYITQATNAAGCTNTSDARLKTDIVVMAENLEKIIKLQPVTYRWKDEKAFGKGINQGFLAQEVEKVIPEIVVKPYKDHPNYGMYQNALIPYLVGAMKEMKVLFDHQDTRLTKLEKENAELKASLETLRQQIQVLNTRPR